LNRKTVVIFIIIALFILINAINSYYLDWLWFESMEYGKVFTTMLFSQLGIRILFFFIFFAFLYFNFRMARNHFLNPSSLSLRQQLMTRQLGNLMTKRNYNLANLGISALTAFLFTAVTSNYWLPVLKFLNRVPFEIKDPILNQDIGYYVFQLPFYLILRDFFLTSVILTIILIGALYFVISFSPGVTIMNWWQGFEGKKHLTFLVSLLFMIKAYDYRLQLYELLFSPRGAAFGASYTDVNIQMPVLRILMVISLVLAVFLLYKTFRPDTRSVPLAVMALLIASLALGSAYPALIQNFRVEPNEMVYEMPYLEHNIAFTQQAYGLEDIKKEIYPAEKQLAFEDLEDNQGTLQNVRLWDPRPIIKTYNQLQGLRPYYRFDDIDIDRYTIDGTYRQVMLSARELDQQFLPDRAKTWVNQKLRYTHGYGVTMNPVNEVTNQGLPNFIVRNIPPRTETDIVLDKPEIYYGEVENPYVVVNTNTEEFNYPMGDTNAYTSYDGDGGVPVNSFFRKILFALRFNDHRIILANDITNESQVMFDRSIGERVRKTAPFLEYDGDPYIVINDGRLFWIQDAYTTTNKYPYSEPQGNQNYIRNSVKVVIDAYHGKVDYYVFDDQDPLVQVYSNIFPELFKPIEEIPQGLFEHLRYPEDLFNIQSNIFTLYHMEDPRVFYNKEDEWKIPMEVYEGQQQEVEPYYNILQIPGEEEPEFVLMLPYNPIRRDNMVSWLAARCDGNNLGEMVLYLFPKDKTIFGPLQIEGRIDQNARISEQLTLWDQRGSNVIRGNLLVLPISDSIIYVEPVFIQADQGQLPELARVIVVHDERVVMEENLQTALVTLFGEAPEEIAEADVTDRILTLEELITQANELMDKAESALKQGDWSLYGEYQDELQSTLEKLGGMVEEEIEDIDGTEDLLNDLNGLDEMEDLEYEDGLEYEDLEYED